MTLCVPEIITLHTEACVYETQLCYRSYAGKDGEDFHVICSGHRNIWGNSQSLRDRQSETRRPKAELLVGDKRLR